MATTEQDVQAFIAALPPEQREIFFAEAISKRQTVEAGRAKRPDIIEWMESNFYLMDTGRLITLFDFQAKAIRQAVSLDENGHYNYATVLWSWPKKSAKTSVLAALADYVADNTPRARIALIANDQRQADSRVGDYIRENIKIAQQKGKRRGIRITPSGYKIQYPNGALIEMLAIDPQGEAGGNHDLLIFSELHGWKSTAHQKMWAEMTLSPNKFGRSQRWIDSYAGYDSESPVLETLYNTAVKEGRQLWDDLEAYENRSARMFATWVTKPMFPWQTEAYYREEAATLPQNEFDRMHRNKWVSSSETFIQPEWWDACKVAELPPTIEYDHTRRYRGEPLSRSRPYVFAIDAAVSGDCFGIVGLTKHYQEATKDYIFVPRYAKKWTPPKGGIIDFAEPEAEIRRLADELNVVCWIFDPYQMADMSHRLSRDGVGWFREMNQMKARNLADKMLWDTIVQRRLQHDGTLHDLREHITNANAEITSDHKMRIVKRNESRRIDLCVCLSMAVATADYLTI